jgi:glutaredoxin-like protein NrdH
MDLDQLPYVDISGDRRTDSLVFYSLSTCVMCRKAQAYLAEAGFAYKYLLVDKLDLPVKTALKDELSRRHEMRVTFPALVIDGQRVVLGFFRQSWEEALGAGRRDG